MYESKLINFNGKIVDINTIAGISKEYKDVVDEGDKSSFIKKYRFSLKCITDIKFPLLTLNKDSELEVFIGEGDNSSEFDFYTSHKFIEYHSKLYDTEKERDEALSYLYEYLKSYVYLVLNDSPHFG